MTSINRASRPRSLSPRPGGGGRSYALGLCVVEGRVAPGRPLTQEWRASGRPYAPERPARDIVEAHEAHEIGDTIAEGGEEAHAEASFRRVAAVILGVM